MKVRITAEGSSEEFDGMSCREIVEYCNRQNDPNFRVVKAEIIEHEQATEECQHEWMSACTHAICSKCGQIWDD
jgi:hypothetical protein